jgi:hypothetical protein
MMTPARIVRLIGIFGLFGWLGMVGWVAKTTRAQNQGQTQPPAGPTAVGEQHKELAPPPISPDSAPPAIPATPSAVGRLEPRSADAGGPPPAPPIQKAKEQSAAPAAGPAPDPAATGANDPEGTAQSFVDGWRKEAEEHLTALTAEAEQLRQRLAKLDSGIKRWERLLAALKSAQSQSVASNAPEGAVDLEPVKQNQSATNRSDRRVRWANATPASPPAEGQHTDAPRDLEPIPAAPPGALQGSTPAQAQPQPTAAAPAPGQQPH